MGSCFPSVEHAFLRGISRHLLRPGESLSPDCVSALDNYFITKIFEISRGMGLDSDVNDNTTFLIFVFNDKSSYLKLTELL